MRRLPALLLLTLLCLPGFSTGKDWTSVRLPKHVDLNAPDALEKLATENPSHYKKIRAILAGLRGRPAASAAMWMRASFDARDVSYGDLYRTSYPPKKDIALRLAAPATTAG